MSFSETKRPSDAHLDHIDKKMAPNHLDLLRLISSQQSKETLSIPSSAQDKGKGPASPQKNERAIGEDGKPVPRTVELARVSTPEHPILLGGMRRGGDQAGMRRGTRADDLARMSPSEQVDWCVQGGIADAFRPDGDRTLVPAVMQMLRNEQSNYQVRKDIAKAIGTLGDRSAIPEMMQML